MNKDVTLLTGLAIRLTGRTARPLAPRLQRWRSIVRRDPVSVAHRYLRRFAGGEWYRGGSHVARLFSGPGIGFRNWSNDRAEKLQPVLLNQP